MYQMNKLHTLNLYSVICQYIFQLKHIHTYAHTRITGPHLQVSDSVSLGLGPEDLHF